jgi:Asp-tRNA(Asn)/Glu-tRNA(Gln) amidotransferase A subunit family amidase
MNISLANDNNHMNWKQSSISEVQAAVRAAKPTATELAKLCFAEIESQNAAINAYLTVSRERALVPDLAYSKDIGRPTTLPS